MATISMYLKPCAPSIACWVTAMLMKLARQSAASANFAFHRLTFHVCCCRVQGWLCLPARHLGGRLLQRQHHIRQPAEQAGPAGGRQIAAGGGRAGGRRRCHAASQRCATAVLSRAKNPILHLVLGVVVCKDPKLTPDVLLYKLFEGPTLNPDSQLQSLRSSPTERLCTRVIS